MIEIYDKAKYHLEGEFPPSLTRHQAFVHTGLFLGWMADHNLLSAEFRTDFSSDITQFKDRKITGPRLYEIAGGAFDETMLTDDGNRFARYYFDFEKGNFVSDYQALLASGLPSFFHVPDTWENYDRLARRIEQRFVEWQTNRTLVR